MTPREITERESWEAAVRIYGHREALRRWIIRALSQDAKP